MYFPPATKHLRKLKLFFSYCILSHGLPGYIPPVPGSTAPRLPACSPPWFVATVHGLFTPRIFPIPRLPALRRSTSGPTTPALLPQVPRFLTRPRSYPRSSTDPSGSFGTITCSLLNAYELKLLLSVLLGHFGLVLRSIKFRFPSSPLTNKPG